MVSGKSNLHLEFHGVNFIVCKFKLYEMQTMDCICEWPVMKLALKECSTLCIEMPSAKREVR